MLILILILKCSNRQNLIDIALKAWEEISSDLIYQSFELTGLYIEDNQHFLKASIKDAKI